MPMLETWPRFLEHKGNTAHFSRYIEGNTILGNSSTQLTTGTQVANCSFIKHSQAVKNY